MSASLQTIELLSLIQSSKSTDQLAEVLGHVAKNFGFRSFALTQHERRPDGAAARLVLDGLPTVFQRKYIANDYGRVSPVTRRVEMGNEPFSWHEIIYDAESEHGRIVMDDAADAGLEDGYTIPLRLPDGRRGSVNFGGDYFAPTPEDRLALQALALAAHAQWRHLSTTEEAPGPKLSGREREVLHWTAAGKTAEETGRILSISVRTVEYHLLNASRKMNTVNRTHTVVEALRSRQLSL